MNTKTLETRWMIRRDLPEVLELELQKNEHPWTEDDWLRYLCTRNHIGVVAETGKWEIIGAMLYRLDTAGFEIVHLVALTLESADALVERLKRKLSQQRRTWLESVVPETDLNSQLFFQRQGFVAYEIEHGRFDDQDGYRMLYSVSERASQ